MVQRYQHRTFQEELTIARQQLAPNYQQLQQIALEQLTSSNSAEIIVSMLNRLSSPIIGSHIIRNDLYQIQFPYLAQYQIILEKAEYFYYQSMIQDLNKMRNNQIMIQVNKQEIKRCVQQLNWKVNLQKSSIVLNESEEIGQNMDLMKFFEGVRNYQNWNQNIKRNCLQKLKEKSHTIQNSLAFKKGFILLKIAHQVQKTQANHKGVLFKINKNHQKISKVMSILLKIQKSKIKQWFKIIVNNTQKIFPQIKLKDIFTTYLKRKTILCFKKLTNQIKQKVDSYEKCENIIEKIMNKRQMQFQSYFFHKINTKSLIKAMNFMKSFEIIAKVCKRLGCKIIIKTLNIPSRILFNTLSNLYYKKIQQPFKEFKDNDIKIRLGRPNVSDRIKGKILVSLNKYQKEPINLKKTFGKWYLNTHETIFSKKIYNIWLNGSTSKFTVFMRLKNMVDLINKQMISKQMKNFIKILCDRYQKYEQFNKKSILSKWIENTRRIRKIEHAFKLLTDVTDQTFILYKKIAFETIHKVSHRKKVVHNYCSRYLQQYVQNIKLSFQKWKNINNIKKQWGKKRLRMLILFINTEMTHTQRQTLNIMKQYCLKGRQLKMIQCRKALTKDLIFMQRFFQLWRTKKSQLFKLQQQKMENKQKAIFILQKLTNKRTNFNLQYTLTKINQFNQLKIIKLKRFQFNFTDLLSRIQQNNKIQIINILKQNWKEGKHKKQKLIIKLINSNVIKQKIGLVLFKNNVREIISNLKRQKCTKIFNVMENKIKQNYLIFNTKLHVDKILRKIVINYADNVKLSFNLWKYMPLRMRWGLRNKVINFQNNLISFVNKRLSLCNQSFKSSFITSKMKQKKALYIMACQFQMVIKKYFMKYRENANKTKYQLTINNANKIFQNLQTTIKDNFRVIFKSPSEWGKKMDSFIMLETKVKKRLREHLLKWQSNVASMKYYYKIMDEKKKRCLQILSKSLLTNQGREIKKTIQSFHKNAKIIKLQENFLKKLCDSQAGKIIKGFNLWKNMPVLKNKQKLVKATKFQSNLHKLIIRNLKFTLLAFKDSHYFGNQSKKYCIRKLVSKSCSSISNYFFRWRQNKRLIMIYDKNRKLQHIFDTIQNQQKPFYKLLFKGDQTNKKYESMKIIQNWWIRQQQYYIKRWFTNTNKLKLKDVTKKYLLSNLVTIKKQYENRQLYNKVISNFMKNRNQKLKQKKVHRSQNLLYAIQTYERNKRALLVSTIDRLKFEHIKGNFLKNKAFHKFLQQRISEVHNILDTWNKLAQYTKQMHRQRIVSHNINSLFQIVKTNYSAVLSKSRQTMIKKNSLQKIFNVQDIKFRGMFNLWRQRVKQLKLLAQLDNKNKKIILQKISKIINNSSKEKVVEIINKFNMNAKIQKVQRRFMDKLLNTKSGKAVNAFKAWKAIPVNNLGGKYKKYQKFYFRLEQFYLQKLKFASQIFNQSNENGNLMKKQSILKLFEMTSLGIRRYYNRWTRLTKEKLMLMGVNSTFKAFQSAQDAIANQYKIVFQDQRAYNIKISAIEKLIKVSRGNTQNYFNVWRQRIRQLALVNKMGNQQKIQALRMFTNVIGNSQTGQIISIIQKFQKNASIVRISRKFFNKLLNTKTGKAISFFEKLKSIPDAKMNKLKKKGIIFESRLSSFVIKRFKFGLNPFKDSIYHASTKKKYCLERLLRACMGQSQKKFLIWRNVIRQGKMLAHTSLFEKVFINVQNTYRNNYELLTKDANAQIQKKKNLSRKLINNSSFVQHHAYMIWKQAYRIDNININKKKTQNTLHLKNLINIFHSHKNKKIVQSVGAFRKILQLRTFQDYDYYKNYKHKKIINFYERLTSLHNGKKYVFISALKGNMNEMIHSNRSEKILSVFQTLSQVTQNNFNQLMRTQKQTKLLNKTFNKYCEKTMLNLRKVFAIWRQNKNEGLIKKRITKQLKNKMIIQLLLLIKKKKDVDILNAVKKMKKFKTIEQIKKQFCLKLIKNKSNKFSTAFSKWKSLPYQQAKKLKNKATKFQKRLIDFMINRLKLVHEVFRSNRLEGVLKKQNATRNIVKSKIIDINDLFFKWRRFNNEKKVTSKIMSLDKTFNILQDIVKKNINIFQGCKIQDHRKIQAATTLFNNNVKRLKEYLLLWKKQAKIKKYHAFQRLLRNYVPQDYNNKLMRLAWVMIQKKKDIQVMKGYINSLWKWKLSNIQATYYGKFIKIFKESEQLIKLSNLLNKKLHENIHNGFRNILKSSQLKQNRKKQIVQKYFTRKIRNYFLAFKDATTKQQINVWRSKYTQCIKGKIAIDVFTSIFNKSKSQSLIKIKEVSQYYVKIIKFKDIIDSYCWKNLSVGFLNIYNDKYLTLNNTIMNIVHKNHQQQLQNAFYMLKNNYKITKMTHIIIKIMSKRNKMYGFTKIHLRKERIIKSTLSLNLLQTLLNQNIAMNIKYVISLINKNKQKALAVNKLSSILAHKEKQAYKYFIDKSLNLANMSKLLQRLNKGKAIVKILQKQDVKLKRQYLNKMKLKQNKWMELSIQKFATRASIRSSPAICLWRLKTYIINS